MSKKRYTLRLSKGLVSDVDDVASRRGESRTALVEHALASYLSRLEDREDQCHHRFQVQGDVVECPSCGLVVPLAKGN